jgi:hypothetical protein
MAFLVISGRVPHESIRVMAIIVSLKSKHNATEQDFLDQGFIKNKSEAV